ncbi:MAG: beta-lactamase [Planctomycetes bacterium]|nr:beta-lactamase [Planctomycetota bacterium]
MTALRLWSAVTAAAALGLVFWVARLNERARAADDRLASVVESSVRPLLAAHDVPGLALGVVVRGEPRFFCFGVACSEPDAAVSPQTLFEIGSISKTFAATLGAYADVEGNLSLSDHPSRFLPELRGSELDRATLLHLATYTAGGLPLQFPAEVSDSIAMLAYFRQWRPTAPPGAQRRYSNPSIGLFGRCAAIALGGDFVDVVESTLLPAFGLRDTFIRVPESAMPRYAWGRNRGGAPTRVQPGVLGHEAYGIKTSASDLLRFVTAHLQPQRLTPPWRAAVERTHVGHFALGAMEQGLGWEQYPYPIALEALLAGNDRSSASEAGDATAPPAHLAGARLFQKAGSTNGFSAYAAFVPSHDVGVVLLANRSFPIPARITAAHAVLRELTGNAGS